MGAESEDSCLNADDGFHPAAIIINGTCYRFSKTFTNFDEAKTICDGVNGQLIEPKSKEINDKLAKEARHVIGTGAYWLGIVDKLEDGKWRYISNGNEITFENWSSGQPNGESLHNSECSKTPEDTVKCVSTQGH